MRVDASSAWVLSGTTLTRVTFGRYEPPVSFEIRGNGRGTIANFEGGIVAGFSDVGALVHVSSCREIVEVPLPCKGVSALTEINAKVAVGYAGSGMIRLLSIDGREESIFVGHTAELTNLQRLSENMFASTANDETARIWDIRDRSPVANVLSQCAAVTALAGDIEYFICGFKNETIGVVDIRGANKDILFAAQTHDYVPVALNYDSATGSLAMFGRMEQRAGQEFLLFLDDRPRPPQLFRTYPEFIRRDRSK
jgi:hypothetical protein